MSATRARQLMGRPAGDSVIDFRDRVTLKFYLYSGARNLHRLPAESLGLPQDGDGATIRLHEECSGEWH
ncbi:MAG: hypothetical protein HYR60_20020 [Acidobacteria bacterium]|nr:hypothetical protein [Acidobacteriota bacterium]